MRDKASYIVGAVVIAVCLVAVYAVWSGRKAVQVSKAAQAQAQAEADQLPPDALVSPGGGTIPPIASIPPPRNRFDHLAPRGPQHVRPAMEITGPRSTRGIELGNRLSSSGSVPPGPEVGGSLTPPGASGRGGTIE